MVMYEQIAHYYDLTHDSLQEDLPLIMELARQADGPVLELGCGSGRLLLPIASAGSVIIGVDNSPAMLTLARRKVNALPDGVQQRIQLHQADMSAPALDNNFALILIPYNTLMHLDTRQAQATLTRAAKLRQPGGKLFVDLLNPFTAAATPDDQLLSLENSMTDPESGDIILQFAANRLDASNQQLHITWIYDRSPAGGGPIHRTVAETTYHYRFPHQLELLLRDSGWNRIQLLGNYDRAPFTEESERLLIIAE